MADTVIQPRLLLAGPMLGRNQGWVTTQGEILADLFENAGYAVMTTSSIPGRVARLVDTIRSLIAWRKQYDLVFLNVFSGPAFGMAEITSALAKLLNKPLVMVLRGGNLPEFALAHGDWIKRVLSRADRIVAPSTFLAEFAHNMGLDVTVIPNVLRLEEYPFRLREGVQPKILWMRTFHEIYHPEMAIEVLDRIRQSLPDATLTMAGQEKGLLNAVRDLAHEKGLDASVRFAGFLDLEAKRREFSAHDIFINTNRVDNSPVSVLEAAAFGLPVVATRVGGVPYLLEHEQTGLLVEDSDVPAMSAEVLRLLREPGLAEKLSRNGRVLAESCSWEKVKPAWEEIFVQATDHHFAR